MQQRGLLTYQYIWTKKNTKNGSQTFLPTKVGRNDTRNS